MEKRIGGWAEGKPFPGPLGHDDWGLIPQNGNWEGNVADNWQNKQQQERGLFGLRLGQIDQFDLFFTFAR